MREIACHSAPIDKRGKGTLKYANTLKRVGVLPEQDETRALMLADALEVNLKDIVTKEYLDTRLSRLQQRMTIKLGAMMVIAIGVIVALIRLP
jgi:hypothetical protein